MSKFKLSYVGEEQTLSFVCSACGEMSYESSYDTYNRPYKKYMHQPGQCRSCEGTGFMAGPGSDICPDCEGSGICASCHGKYLREWFELPSEVQEEWHDHWKGTGSFPVHYNSLLALYRNW